MGSRRKASMGLLAFFLSLFFLAAACRPAYAVVTENEEGYRRETDFGVPQKSITPAEPELQEQGVVLYRFYPPSYILGNQDPQKVNSASIGVTGDLSRELGLDRAMWTAPDGTPGFWFATNWYNGAVYLYFKKGQSYDVRFYSCIWTKPGEGAIRGDYRVMRQRYDVAPDGMITVHAPVFETPEGKIAGNQLNFVGVDRQPFSEWTDAEKAKADWLMMGMSLEEKAGQVFLLHYPGDGAGTAAQANEYIDKYHPGGFLAFAKMFEGSNPSAVKAKTDAAQAHTAIPLIFSVDEEGGKVTRISQFKAFYPQAFPYPQALASGGTAAVEADARAKAELLKGLGFNVNHAPVCDVSGPSGYIYQRTYGQDGLGNGKLVKAAVKGMEENGVATTLKHFPGYGGTSSNTHNGYAVNDLSMDDFYYNDLLPFYAGISAGSSSVMVTHNIVQAFDAENPASLSPAVIGYLRDTMGFDGVVMTDDLGMGAIVQNVPAGQASLRALLAGVDMPMTATPETDYPVVLQAAKDGTLPMSRLNEAVHRILCWKIRMGLIPEEIPDFPEDTEARYIRNGSVLRAGDFGDMWKIALNNPGGAVELLKDCSSGALTAAGDIALNLNGRTLTVPGVEVPEGAVFSVYDMDDFNRGRYGTVSGKARAAAPVISSGTDGWDSAKEVLRWTEVDGIAGTRIQKAVNFSGAGRVLGSGDSVVTVSGGSFCLNGGYLTGTGRGLTQNSGASTIDGGAVLGCGLGTTPVNGGGVAVLGGEFAMPAGFVGGNKASGNGGGMYLAGTYRDDKNGGASLGGAGSALYVCANEAGGSGGGIYYAGEGHFWVWNGVIASNRAARDGGGIAQSNFRDLELGAKGQVLVTANEAGGNGGGVWASRETTVWALDGSVSGNKSDNGAGIYLDDRSGITCTDDVYDNKSGILDVENTYPGMTVSYNSAEGNGGGVAAAAITEVELKKIRIHDNRAHDGGGVWANGSNLGFSAVEVRDNIADQNAGLRWPNGFYVDFNATVVIDGNTTAGGEPSDVFLPINCVMRIKDGSLVPGSVIRFNTEARPTPEVRVPVVSGERGAVQNSRHAFVLADAVKDYPFLLHEERGVLELRDPSTLSLAVPVNGVLFQWYAEARRIAETGDVSRTLSVMDTSVRPVGNKLVKNGEMNPTLRYIYLNNDGTVNFETKLREIYKSRDLEISQIGSPASLWHFGDSDAGYARGQVWVREDGEKALSLDPSDWTVYDWHAGMGFTTNPDKAGSNSIYINRGHVVRFVGTPRSDESDFDTIFHDYDITDGQVYENGYDAQQKRNPLQLPAIQAAREEWIRIAGSGPAGTSLYITTESDKGHGINDASNYAVESTNNDRFVFGNANMGVAARTAKHDGMFMNQRNRKGGWGTPDLSYLGCHFGIVKELGADKLPVFNDGIHAPELFAKDKEDAVSKQVLGRTSHTDLSLRFLREGNSLVLNEVVGADGSVLPNAGNLAGFRHPGHYDNLWSNDFWPMDSLVTDGDGHDLKLGGNRYRHDGSTWVQVTGPLLYFQGDNTNGNVPCTDDEEDHNYYFGMQSTVEFTLDADYVGPMEYVFFGDDDMWVFLDDTQIVDIGGIHSAVGMYVDLYDYLDPTKDFGKHVLRFFYLERGGSGSNCWINMYLPGVRGVTDPLEYPGSLRIEKTVGEGGDQNKDFKFEVTLDLTDAEGNTADGSFPYHGSEIGTIRSGDTVELSHGEYIIVEDLPAGTRYSVRELPAAGYQTVYPGNESGVIAGDPVVVSVLNTVEKPSFMPETGGEGTGAMFLAGGLLWVLAEAVLLLRRRKRSR